MPTPQRLPIVNSDDGVWGDILRQYLLKEHYDDGTDNAVNGGHKTITIRPGTASAGTAPLKFTTGTLLTTPEAGAMEFAGDNYYLTDTSGPTRRKIAAYDDTSGATGDIYYRNSSGYFTRLAVGSTGDFLTVSGGIPSWSSSISNASTITLKDINFTLQDNTDTSKQLKFELSGISASTTRTLTVPDANTTIVGTDATQTLTNKTLTSPTVNNIFNNSVRAINFSSAAGAVDYFDVNNVTGTVGLRALGTSTNIGITLEPKGNGKTSIYAATGQTPAIAATGADTNVSLNLTTKGTGTVQANGVPVVTTTGTETLTNKTLTSPRVNQILDTNGATAFNFSGTSNAVNHLWAANAVASDFPKLRALGSDTDVSLGFRPKGAGTFRFQADSGEDAFQIVPIASAVNYFRFDSSATGSPLPIWAGGLDTAISINLRPKGAGTVQANGVEVATISGTQTLTNKTIDASSNTVSNLDTADFAASAIVTESEGISSNDNDTTLPTSAAVKDYVDKGGIVYATTDTAGTYNGQYTPILQVDITAQYTTGRFLARVLTSGAPPPEYVDIDLYVDQYDVLGGSDPTMTLKVKNATAGTVDEDQFIAVLTTHTGSQSTVTLYVKIDDIWKVWLVQPKFNDFSAGAGTYAWLSSQSYVASLPGGTQSVGVAGDVIINDDKFVLQDSSDKTKKLKFELSSISASTTRTLTVPDASGTIALTSDIAAAGGMLAPAQGMTLGSETFTISSGTVTQISGTTINGYTPAIGDRILVANAPATTGTGSSYSMTSQPTNGIYVVTGNTTNLTVSRATDMSGSVKPGGLSVYVQNATWPGSKTVFYVDTPNNLSAFTWGTTNLRFTYAGGPSGKMTQVWVTENALGYNIYNGTGWTYFGATANSGNQDLTLPATATDTIVARTSTDTLTNKTISGASNTITDIPVSALPAKHPVERLNLTSGLTTLPRPNSYTNIGADLASETLLLVYLYPDENRTINDLTLLVQEAGGTATLAQLAVFSADGSGNLTSIATTTHDASLVVSAWTTKTKSLSSSVSLVAGSTYAVGLLLVSSNAMPGIGGALGHWDEFALAPRLTGRVYGQTSMPSSVNVGDIQTTSSAMYIRLS